MKKSLSRIRDWVDGIFPEREVYFRSNGRVAFLRISQKRQLQGVALLGVAAVWGISTTAVSLLSTTLIAERDAKIEQQQEEYIALLSDVSEYQIQYDRIVAGLEENQGMLLGMLEDGSGQSYTATPGFENSLKTTDTERARMLLARDALTARLSSFGDELEEVAEENEELETKLTSMKLLLQGTEAEREQLDEARNRLVRRLDEVESSLEQTLEVKKALREELEEAGTSIADLDQQRDSLIQEREQLKGEIAALAQQQDGAKAREEEFRAEIAFLQSALEEAQHARADLIADRDLLSDQVVQLEGKLRSFEKRQIDLVTKMTERTLSSISDFEEAMELTGLKLDTLINRVAGEEVSGVGGPFVPLDAIGPNSEGSFDTALSMLDLHLRRWESIRQLATVLPLSSPLDAYEVNSTYGPRKDPLNKARSFHDGLDMGAPTGTQILSPAPGKVTFAGWSGGYGRFIEVDHGFGVTTRYGHLRSIEVKKGDEVGFRQMIGTVGSSGRSTGPHLHYEIRLDDRSLDPDNFLEAGRHLFKG